MSETREELLADYGQALRVAAERHEVYRAAVAPALLALLREQQTKLDWIKSYCEQGDAGISTDPEVGEYERGFDDSTRGMSARIRAALGASND